MQAEPISRANSPSPVRGGEPGDILPANVPSIVPPRGERASVSAPGNVPQSASEPLKWVSGGRGWLHAEVDNGWKNDPSQPAIEIRKQIRNAPGEGSVIVTRRIHRAASRTRDVVTEQTKPMSQADPLDHLMMSYPIELPQHEDLDPDEVAAPTMRSLQRRQMEIVSIHPGLFMRMHDGYARRQDVFASGSNRAPHRTVLVYIKKGDYLGEQEIQEYDLGREAGNPRICQSEALIRPERLPRQFLDFFHGGAGPAVDDWNRKIRQGVHDETGGPHSRPVPIFQDDTVRGSDTESQAESDTASAEAASGRQSPSSDAGWGARSAEFVRGPGRPATDNRLVAYGGSRISSVELANQLNPLDLADMQVFRNGPGHVVAIDGMWGPQPTIHMLRLVENSEPPQVAMCTARILNYHHTDTSLERTVPLSAFDPGIQRDLKAQAPQESGGFRREWLVGPDPEKLKNQFFKVATAHRAHQPGRCVVLDNESSFERESYGREQQKFTLSRDGSRIEVTVRNRNRASTEDQRRGSTVAERYALPTTFFHEDVVALVKGNDGSVDRWNEDVSQRMWDWAQRSDYA